MVSEVAHMAAPVCLIENRPDGTLVIREKAAASLAQIRQPVVVVAIVGLYRTGKSYLMNRLAGRRKGFCLGATVQAMTKGIWMWCLPHPQKQGCTLVLLDTEGLGDVGKANTQNDSWIFALAILLSSTFVYNSMGTIDENALEKLHYVTELTKKIRTKSSPVLSHEDEDSAEFIRFFPAFIWAVRDFTLALEIDGCLVSDDGYLENALKLQKGDTEQVTKSNMPRICIRHFFPSRKCFTFDRPTNRRNLSRLEELEEDELEEEFLEPMNRFCQHVWGTSRPKMVPGGHVVTGSMLVNLMKTYVDAINNGQVPCLENAVVALSKIENSAAVCEAISYYEEQMQKHLKLPTNTVEELLEVHKVCEREAVAKFMAQAFLDNLKTYQEELQEKLNQKLEEFCQKNKEISLDRCRAVLLDLSQELKEGVHLGLYSVPGGYKKFMEKRHEIEEKYHLVPGKGIQAEEALREFLKSKESEANAILQMDKTLSDKEKEIEAQRAQAEAAQMQQKMLEQEQIRLKQMMEDQKRSHDEQCQLLREHMEKEKKKMEEETDRILQHKLQEEKKLLEEGFYQKARQMEAEIQQLKEEKKNIFVEIADKVLPHAVAFGSQLMEYKLMSRHFNTQPPKK
ncbi:guanylate-binding protein 1 isoform X1 [Pogona vitticeps]